MKRRRVLAGAAAALGVVAGCLERGPRSPEGTSVGTRHVAGSYLADAGIGASGERVALAVDGRRPN